jgi:signal transduction histidine kinase
VNESADTVHGEIEALRASRKRIAMAADAHRREIERALHDGVQQELVALVVKLQLARRLVETDLPGAVELLEEIRHIAQAALDETRQLALRAYPPLPDAVGLRTALRAVATEIEPAPAIEVALGARCPEDLMAAAYFCCVELLERLPAVEAIAVREHGSNVDVEVIARGSPADLTQVADRVEALDGRLLVVTDDDGRARATCSLPLP